MAAQPVPFDDFVRVVRAVEGVARDGSGWRGEIRPDTPELLEALRLCGSNAYETGLTVEDSLDDLAVGRPVAVVLTAPRVGFGALKNDLSDLLRTDRYRAKAPRFILLEPSFFASVDSSPPELVRTYRAVLSLVALLQDSAAFLDTEKSVLVFVRAGKFEVPIRYGAEDLAKIDVASIERLIAAVGQDMQRTEKLSILAEALCSMTESVPADRRFQHVLMHFSDLYGRFEEGFRIYAAKFSYEKVRDEVEVARIEYATKIHKAMSDIQNQLLGIPVATLIAATQMKITNTVGVQMAINAAVLLGSWLFCALAFFLFGNQRDTLDVIGAELRRQEDKLAKEYAGAYGRFKQTFRDLETRVSRQHIVLIILQVVVLVGAVGALVFFIGMTKPVWRGMVGG